MANYSRQLYIRIGTQLPMTPHATIWSSKPLSAYTKSSSITTIMSTLHKHMAFHCRIPNAATHMHPHTPIKTYRHSDITYVYPPWLHSPLLPPPFLPIRHTQLILDYGQHNGTSRHTMKIKVSPNDYETHQPAHSYGHYLGSSVKHCS